MLLELSVVEQRYQALDTRGLIKIVRDRSNGRVLGVHALAEGAGDMIPAGLYAVKFGLTIDDLADTGAPHLTMAERKKLAGQTFARGASMLSCCAAGR